MTARSPCHAACSSSPSRSFAGAALAARLPAQAPAQSPASTAIPTPVGTPTENGLAGFAKILCSAVFISGREPAEAARNSAYFFMPRAEQDKVTFSIDREARTGAGELQRHHPRGAAVRRSGLHHPESVIAGHPFQAGAGADDAAGRRQPGVADGRSAGHHAVARGGGQDEDRRRARRRLRRSRGADGGVSRAAQRTHRRRALRIGNHEGHAARELVDGEEHHRDAVRACSSRTAPTRSSSQRRCRSGSSRTIRAERSATSICSA